MSRESSKEQLVLRNKDIQETLRDENGSKIKPNQPNADGSKAEIEVPDVGTSPAAIKSHR